MPYQCDLISTWEKYPKYAYGHKDSAPDMLSASLGKTVRKRQRVSSYKIRQWNFCLKFVYFCEPSVVFTRVEVITEGLLWA